MRPKHPARSAVAASGALLSAVALIAALAPQAAANPSALPLPLPAAGAEPLVSEGLTIEGPLVNNITLPTLK